MIPSASVVFWMKSTTISLLLSPLIRSMWTIATFPASFTFFTISPMEQISPNKMKTTRMSSKEQQISTSSMLFTAAMIGLPSTAS